MRTPRCRTLVAGTQQTSIVVLLTFFPWTTDRQSAFCTVRCYTRDNSHLSCLLIVSNINGSPYSQAVLHFQVLHFQRPPSCFIPLPFTLLDHQEFLRIFKQFLTQTVRVPTMYKIGEKFNLLLRTIYRRHRPLRRRLAPSLCDAL